SEAAPRSSEATAPARYLPDPLRRVWYLGVAIFTLQFVGLAAWSWHLWSHFDVTNDLATFGQAFSQIGTGHLNPYETTFPYNYPHWGYPFYQSHFELLMWPLALLYTATRSLFTLLVVQDLALAGAGLAALRWGLEYLARRWPDHRRGAPIVAGGLVVLLLVNPWTYWSVSFDFHFQTIAALFAVLAARDGWQGRRRAWLWLALLLACGDVATTYALAVGLVLVLADSRTRRTGVGFVAASLVWLLLIGVLHAAKGSNLSDGYGYLAGHAVPDGLAGMVAIVEGLVTHPHRGLSVLDGRWHALYQYLAGAGLVGVVSVIGLVPVVVVLGANGLNTHSIYVSHIAAFQNVVIVFFMGVGAVTVLTWVVRRRGRVAPVIACVVGVAGLAQACFLSSQVTPQARTMFAAVSGSTAAELAQVEQKVPSGAEAVVSVGVIGRFAARRDIYPYGYSFPAGQIIPVGGRPIYFVFVDAPGVQSATGTATDAAVRQLQAMGARVIARHDHVVALAWTPPPRVSRLRLVEA
ncbi:MAG: DUF2079 domain-containing protein, partial [Acidimicrobiales bacterium]